MKPFVANVLLCVAVQAMASQSKTTADITIAMPTGPGSITISTDQSKIRGVDLIDNNTRPVLTTKDDETGIITSYILFSDPLNTENAEGCRNDVLGALIRGVAKAATARSNSTYKTANGLLLAVASYTLQADPADPKIQLNQHNIFGFAGNAAVCAEIHVSKSNFKPADESAMVAQLGSAVINIDSEPAPQTYVLMGHLFYSLENYGASAAYYRHALLALKKGESSLKERRVVTDQLAISLGITHQLGESRNVLLSAVSSDPTYPLNYYNLACIDSEQGNLNEARKHLQQAFDRKTNTLPGESLPDPSQDDSFTVHKNDTTFWTFVTSLH